MTDPVLRQPTLIGPPVPGAPLTLLARRCVCGHVFFPPQDYGCEACGRSGDALSPIALSGTGTLKSFAVVHRHPSLSTPFVLGTIELDAGPVIDAILDGDTTGFRIGTRCRAVLVPGGRDETGRELLDCRFRAGAPE